MDEKESKKFSNDLLAPLIVDGKVVSTDNRAKPDHVTINHLGEITSGPNKGKKISQVKEEELKEKASEKVEQAKKPRPAVPGSAGNVPGGAAGALATIFGMMPQETSKKKSKHGNNQGLKRR